MSMRRGSGGRSGVMRDPRGSNQSGRGLNPSLDPVNPAVKLFYIREVAPPAVNAMH